jgi:hypothetical protein
MYKTIIRGLLVSSLLFVIMAPVAVGAPSSSSSAPIQCLQTSPSCPNSLEFYATKLGNWLFGFFFILFGLFFIIALIGDLRGFMAGQNIWEKVGNQVLIAVGLLALALIGPGIPLIVRTFFN